MSDYTICVDFDGVLHSYTSPFNSDELSDPPVEGAIEWLRAMTRKFRVVILTTRGQYDQTAILVRQWLYAYGLDWPTIDLIRVTNVKPAALIYIDDRAWRFEGTFPTAEQIHRARPWNKPPSSLPGSRETTT